MLPATAIRVSFVCTVTGDHRHVVAAAIGSSGHTWPRLILPTRLRARAEGCGRWLWLSGYLLILISGIGCREERKSTVGTVKQPDVVTLRVLDRSPEESLRAFPHVRITTPSGRQGNSWVGDVFTEERGGRAHLIEHWYDKTNPADDASGSLLCSIALAWADAEQAEAEVQMCTTTMGIVLDALGTDGPVTEKDGKFAAFSNERIELGPGDYTILWSVRGGEQGGGENGIAPSNLGKGDVNELSH